MSTAPRAKRATTGKTQNKQTTPRADNFEAEAEIAKLEAEIAKRDARIAELERRPSTASLPKLGDELYGGHYSGIVSGDDGVPYALVLHAARMAGEVDWYDALDWANSLECDLPNCREAAMLISIHGATLGERQIWTGEDYHRDATFAWLFQGKGCRSAAESKSITASAVAVRRVQLALGDGQSLIVLQPMAQAPADADDDGARTRQIESSELHRLCGSIQTMDALAQESLKQISAVASLALTSLETPSGRHNTEAIAQVLTLIDAEAVALEERISREAENHGCQWRDEAEQRRMAARGI